MLQWLLPALVPSWGFFDAIGPAPRIEFACDDGPWRALRPVPEKFSLTDRARRLVWDPDGAESLWLRSCAERVADGDRGTAHAAIAEAARSAARAHGASRSRWRVVLRVREGELVRDHEAFVSAAAPVR